MLLVPFLRNEFKTEHYINRLSDGVILHATRINKGPLFENSRVLLTHYSHEGATGFVLSENLNAALSRYEKVGQQNNSKKQLDTRILEHMKQTIPDYDAVYWGGPVAITKRFKVSFSVDSGSIQVDPKPVTNDDSIVMASFVGYSGWRPGQLEQEIRDGDWSVFKVDPNKIKDWLVSPLEE